MISSMEKVSMSSNGEPIAQKEGETGAIATKATPDVTEVIKAMNDQVGCRVTGSIEVLKAPGHIRIHF